MSELEMKRRGLTVVNTMGMLFYLILTAMQ